MQEIFRATDNQVFQQLARPLSKLRNLRTWRGVEQLSLETVVKRETEIIQQLVDAVAVRNPTQARAITANLLHLPPEAVEAMRQTPIGEIPLIPLAYNYQR
jgi:DNA-binding FadR family transcriptional regulator